MESWVDIITSNVVIVLGIILVVMTLLSIGLLSFKSTRKYFVVVSFVVISILIVGILSFIFLSRKTSINPSQFSITLYNYDPSLGEVDITLPNNSTFVLTPGQSQAGLTIEAFQTIKAVGYRTSETGKIPYVLDYVFNNLGETQLYYTCGGVQTNNSFISSLDVNNQNLSPVTLYTQDLKGNIYPYETVPVGLSYINAYVSQFFSTSSTSEGVTLPLATAGIDISSSGVISVTNIPSANLSYVNTTNQDGWLQYSNPWQSSGWTTYDKIVAKGQSTDVLSYLGQWWRIISQTTSSPITDVYIISSSDLTGGNPINLTS